MAAKDLGSRDEILPLYLFSKARACSSSRLSAASIFGSSAEAKRSARFQRTSSAPVVFRASAMASGYPVSKLADPFRLGPPAGVGALVDHLGELRKQHRLHRLFVLEWRLRRSAAAAQPLLHSFVEPEQLVLSGCRRPARTPLTPPQPCVREPDHERDGDRRRDGPHDPERPQLLHGSADRP